MYLATNLQLVFCAFLLTFQDCVQLNQYTLKDEIGKVTIPGDRLVFHTYQGCLGYCGSAPLELGVSEGEGFVINRPSVLLYFVLFLHQTVFLQKLTKLPE